MTKLLIIDDESKIRTGLKSIIQNECNFISEILEAENGLSGQTIIQTCKPDVVITDIKMPEVDGLEMIKRILDTCIDIPEFIIISGYDDFSYAKTAIKYGVRDYLLKPISRNEVIDAIKRSLQQREQRHIKDIKYNESRIIVRDSYLLELVNLYNIFSSNIVERLSSVDVFLTNNFNRVIVIGAAKSKTRDYTSNVEKDIIAAKNIITEITSKHFNNCFVFLNEHHNIVILINESDKQNIENNQIIEMTTGLNEILRRQLNNDFFFGISHIEDNIYNINKCYKQACDALKYKIIEKKQNIHFYDSKDYKDESYDLSNLQNMFIVKIINEIEVCNRNNIICLIDELFKHYIKFEENIYKIEKIYDKICKYVFNYFTIKSNYFVEFFQNKQNNFIPFSEFWDKEQIFLYLKRYLLKMCDYIAENKANNFSVNIVEQMIEYINNNYHSDINLNSMAAALKKNNSYLSVLFKKETGMNFIDYLTNVRIQKAKEILKNTDLKICEVAKKVGYSNEKNFFKAFRKVVGTSPQYYRQCKL